MSAMRLSIERFGQRIRWHLHRTLVDHFHYTFSNQLIDVHESDCDMFCSRVVVRRLRQLDSRKIVVRDRHRHGYLVSKICKQREQELQFTDCFVQGDDFALGA